jgi:hypothetical protein
VDRVGEEKKMSPIKQILLGSAIGIGIGLMIAMSLTWYEIVDPSVPKLENTIVWEGKIGDQDVVLTQKQIENY